MTLKKQINTLKENWLIALLLVVLVSIPLLNTNIGVLQYGSDSFAKSSAGEGLSRTVSSSYYPSPESDFAPDVEQRVITKSASLNAEVKFGSFKANEEKLKSIVKSSDSFLLDENVYSQESGWKEYFTGSYNLKIETEKYDSVLTQLREIGEVKSFSENAQDVTGRYTDLNTELAAEKERLKRYQAMYAEAKDVDDKLNLNDRIFNQERTIKYLEDAIDNIDKRVDYSSVYFTMNEKQSEYASIALVKFSSLVKSLVNSFNTLLTLIFLAVPYLVGILVLLGLKKLVYNKR